MVVYLQVEYLQTIFEAPWIVSGWKFQLFFALPFQLCVLALKLPSYH